MNTFYHKYAKIITFFAVAVFLMVTILGISHSFGMEMNEKGQMSVCPFSGQAAICTMTFAEHLSIWQAMFTAIPQKASLFSILILTLAFALASLIFRERFGLFWAGLSSCLKLYLKRSSIFAFSNHLKESFSQGILNPKIFESAIV